MTRDPKSGLEPVYAAPADLFEDTLDWLAGPSLVAPQPLFVALCVNGPLAVRRARIALVYSPARASRARSSPTVPQMLPGEESLGAACARRGRCGLARDPRRAPARGRRINL